MVIFDIGCNKGYDAIGSLKLYTQDARIDFRRWTSITHFHGCGVCGQCKDQIPLHAQLAKKAVSMHCIEPLPVNFKLVNRSAFTMHLDQLGLQVVHAAFTNTETVRKLHGFVHLPSNHKYAGAETFGIGHKHGYVERKAKKGKDRRDRSGVGDITVQVPPLVLDDYVEAHNVSHIDILSVDTEGSDALVLQGGAHVLRDRVRYVEFEYHAIGPWHNITLASVTSALEDLGFVCYWLGQKKLWRITGCWHPGYEDKGWSNVGCVHRSQEEWLAIMERIYNQTVPVS